MTIKSLTFQDGHPLTPAQISWRGDIPYAAEYNDVYYSEHYSHDGIEEVKRVFLQPSEVTQRKHQTTIGIGELGFGTGLNFLVTADWVLRETDARLHFVSFEAHPLAPSDWQRLTEQRRSKLPLATELCDANLPLLNGWHTRFFTGGRIRLSVFHGPADLGLATLGSWHADAWYLDGFAPDRNGELWQESLLHSIGTHTKANGTVTTFTASGSVRRGLAAVGFKMRKVDQRPHKRESLAGIKQISDTPSRAVSHLHVLGAGIAGASIARQVADEGIDVTVSDPGGIAHGASGMPYTILHPRLLGDGSANAAYRAQAFHFSSHFLKRFGGYNPQSVLHVEPDDAKQKKFDRIGQFYGAAEQTESWITSITPGEATGLAQQTIHNPSFLFNHTAIIDLARMCKHLLNHERISVVRDKRPIDPETPTVVCTGVDARSVEGLEWLEINAVGGRLHALKFDGDCAVIPIVGNGYFIPTNQGAVVGSTYEYRVWDDQEALDQNLNLNQAYLPKTFAVAETFQSARAISSDRNPVVGRVGDNLWVSTGHGSMGTSSAPYAGALIVADLLGLAPVACDEQIKLVDPNRFLERQARRGQLRRDRDRPVVAKSLEPK